MLIGLLSLGKSDPDHELQPLLTVLPFFLHPRHQLRVPGGVFQELSLSLDVGTIYLGIELGSLRDTLDVPQFSLGGGLNKGFEQRGGIKIEGELTWGGLKF